MLNSLSIAIVAAIIGIYAGAGFVETGPPEPAPATPESVMTVEVYRTKTVILVDGQPEIVLTDDCRNDAIWNTNGHTCGASAHRRNWTAS